MQTIETRREYLKAWKEKNRDRWLGIRLRSTRKARGKDIDAPKQVFIPKPSKSRSIESLGERPEYVKPIEVAVCETCARKYLVKLYCLWCNGNYGNR